MELKLFSLPDLEYGHGELAPYISEQQLRVHYEKHHKAYVDSANQILQKIHDARHGNAGLDYKGDFKSLSFNIGGHLLHSIFWKNMVPKGKGGGEPGGEIIEKVKASFGNFERFREEFSKIALQVEGSGWGVLAYLPELDSLVCMPVEKHNLLIVPEEKILLAVDVFEHAYYLDYKNERAKFIDAFWNIVNWKNVNERFLQARI